MVSRGPLSCPPDGLAKPSVRSNTDTSPLSPRGDSPLRTNLWIGPNQPQVDYPCEAQATDFSRGFLIENLGGQAFEGCDGEKPNSQVWHGIRTHASCGVRRPRNNRAGSVLDGAAVRPRGARTAHPQDRLSRPNAPSSRGSLVRMTARTPSSHLKCWRSSNGKMPKPLSF